MASSTQAQYRAHVEKFLQERAAARTPKPKPPAPPPMGRTERGMRELAAEQAAGAARVKFYEEQARLRPPPPPRTNPGTIQILPPIDFRDSGNGT